MNEKRGFFRDNGLSMVVGALFAASLIGQYVAGLSVLNEERLARGEALVPWARYFLEPHFVSATFENWESEFLQMGIYVLLSAWLYQRGSAESQALPGDESPERVDEGPTPWPAARGDLWRRLYGQTLAAALLVLCLLSFLIHWRASWLQHLEQARAEGEPLRDSYATWASRTSGSNPSRTGRANSCRCSRSCCCRSSCARRTRRSPRRSMRRIARRERETPAAAR
jgi:hypothetical protein